MKTSIATVSIAGDFREKLFAIASAGFDGIEIFEQDFIGFEHGPLEAGNLVRDFGLEIMLFQPFRDFEGYRQLLVKGLARARQKFEVMNRLGTDLMLICSSGIPPRLALLIAALTILRSWRNRRHPWCAGGIRSWPGAVVNDHRDAWEIVRRADHANGRSSCYHTWPAALTPTASSIPGDRIFFLQLADAPRSIWIFLSVAAFPKHARRGRPGSPAIHGGGLQQAMAAPVAGNLQ